MFYFFFFFQAEDGIRVLTVTGVQTCALPILAVVPALEKRYSICDTSGVPAACRAAISAGVAQPCAVPVTDVAMPATVSFGEPGTPVTVTCDPIPSCRPDWLDSTICPGPAAQWPAVSVRSSTGPPGKERPARASC